MIRILACMATFVPFVAAAACSSSSDTGSASTLDASTQDAASSNDASSTDSAAEASTDAGCAMIDNVATQIGEVAIADTVPAWTGGTIVDGTYTLTAFESYTGDGGASGPTGQLLRQTLKIENGTRQEVNETADGGVFHVASTYEVSGSEVTFTDTCPKKDGAFIYNYTATPTTISLAPLHTINRAVFTLK